MKVSEISVLKKGQFPGAEVDQNIVNMYPDRPIRHNPNATVEQLRRYSIIDRKGPSYGNLRIENLKPGDQQLSFPITKVYSLFSVETEMR